MNKRMTTEQLEAIRKRAEMATEGPWRRALYKVRGGSMDYQLADPPRVEDAEFISKAREDIPTLIAEVERLRATLESVKSEIGHALYSKKSTDVKRFYLENAIRYIERESGGDTE